MPDGEQAPRVREAFTLYATGEWSLTALSDEMADRGLRNRRGRPLARSKLPKLLKNWVYLAKVVWGGVNRAA